MPNAQVLDAIVDFLAKAWNPLLTSSQRIGMWNFVMYTGTKNKVSDWLAKMGPVAPLALHVLHILPTNCIPLLYDDLKGMIPSLNHSWHPIWLHVTKNEVLQNYVIHKSLFDCLFQ